MSEKDFAKWQDSLIQAEKDKGENMFMGVPDRWYEPATYGCRNGHISSRYLKSEAKGGDCCLACGEYVGLIPPEFHGKDDAELKSVLASFVEKGE